jgi:hypothetical protein
MKELQPGLCLIKGQALKAPQKERVREEEYRRAILAKGKFNLFRDYQTL